MKLAVGVAVCNSAVMGFKVCLDAGSVSNNVYAKPTLFPFIKCHKCRKKRKKKKSKDKACFISWWKS